MCSSASAFRSLSRVARSGAALAAVITAFSFLPAHAAPLQAAPTGVALARPSVPSAASCGLDRVSSFLSLAPQARAVLTSDVQISRVLTPAVFGPALTPSPFEARLLRAEYGPLAGPPESMLSSLGGLRIPPTPQDLKDWKDQLHQPGGAMVTPTTRERLARLHLWLGEYAMAHDEAMDTAL